ARRFELRVLSDPAPAVTLERPSSSHDSLAILPEAEVPLRVTADDPSFAVRSVYLRAHCRDKRGQPKPLPVDRLPLYDPDVFAAAARALLAGLAATPFSPTPFSPPAPFAPRPARVQAGRVWGLAGLGLEEGDLLTLQACADDWDD